MLGCGVWGCVCAFIFHMHIIARLAIPRDNKVLWLQSYTPTIYHTTSNRLSCIMRIGPPRFRPGRPPQPLLWILSKIYTLLLKLLLKSKSWTRRAPQDRSAQHNRHWGTIGHFKVEERENEKYKCYYKRGERFLGHYGTHHMSFKIGYFICLDSARDIQWETLV